MKILFLDESGDHNLSIIDPAYPLFVLGGIIVDLEYAEKVMEPALTAFKEEIFGTADMILHTSDITRNRNGFECLKDVAVRSRFYDRLNRLMDELEYKVVACVVRKEEHLQRYGVAALDPYMLSLDILVERFSMEIGNVQNGGMIIAEKRGGVLDRQMELAWINLKVQGTQYMQATDIRRRIQALHLRGKRENVAGLQLADLVVSPIGRKVLGKEAREDWNIIERKFRRSWDGKVDGYGLVVLPK